MHFYSSHSSSSPSTPTVETGFNTHKVGCSTSTLVDDHDAASDHLSCGSDANFHGVDDISTERWTPNLGPAEPQESSAESKGQSNPMSHTNAIITGNKNISGQIKEPKSTPLMDTNNQSLITAFEIQQSIQEEHRYGTTWRFNRGCLDNHCPGRGQYFCRMCKVDLRESYKKNNDSYKICTSCKRKIWHNETTDFVFKWCQGCHKWEHLSMFRDIQAGKCKEKTKQHSHRKRQRRQGESPTPPV